MVSREPGLRLLDIARHVGVERGMLQILPQGVPYIARGCHQGCQAGGGGQTVIWGAAAVAVPGRFHHPRGIVKSDAPEDEDAEYQSTAVKEKYMMKLDSNGGVP